MDGDVFQQDVRLKWAVFAQIRFDVGLEAIGAGLEVIGAGLEASKAGLRAPKVGPEETKAGLDVP